MSMFIGRKDELKFLEERYQSKEGQLIVLYGRRRVGKTETLRFFCKGKPHVFYSCTECTDEQQLSAFSEWMLRTGMPASQYLCTFYCLVTGNQKCMRIAGESEEIINY